MTGHQSLIDLRLNGYCPAKAHIVALETRPVFGRYDNPEQAMNEQQYPLIVVMPEDSPETLDLRFLRGIIVQVVGNDQPRAHALLARVAQFEPAKAIASGAWGLRAWKPSKGFFDL